MSKWEKAKLKEVCTINPPKKELQSLYESKLVSFIPMSEVTEDGRVNASNERMYSEVSSGFTYFAENDVLFAKITPCMENGKGGVARGLINGLGVGSTEFHVLRPKGNVTSDWIHRFLSYSKFRKLAEKNMTGSGGQRRVPKAFMENVLIPLPPLETQKQIAKTLDAAAELLAMRKQQLAELDNLIKSTFYDMFGDPGTNEQGWKVVSLSEFYEDPKTSVKCGPFGSALKKDEYVEDGVPVWVMDNITKRGDFIDDVQLYITKEKFNQLNSYNVRTNDIIISRAGTVGKMCVVNMDYKESIISTNLIRLRLNQKLLPVYVVKLITIWGDRVSRLKTGDDGTFTHMNTGVLNNIKFPYPPLGLQTQFANIVTKIQDQKALVKMAIDETQHLFDSLMNEYFE